MSLREDRHELRTKVTAGGGRPRVVISSIADCDGFQEDAHFHIAQAEWSRQSAISWMPDGPLLSSPWP